MKKQEQQSISRTFDGISGPYVESVNVSFTKKGAVSLRISRDGPFFSCSFPGYSGIQSPSDLVKAWRSISEVDTSVIDFDKDFLSKVHRKSPWFISLAYVASISEDWLSFMTEHHAFFRRVRVPSSGSYEQDKHHALRVSFFVKESLQTTGEFPRGRKEVFGRFVSFPSHFDPYSPNRVRRLRVERKFGLPDVYAARVAWDDVPFLRKDVALALAADPSSLGFVRTCFDLAVWADEKNLAIFESGEAFHPRIDRLNCDKQPAAWSIHHFIVSVRGRSFCIGYLKHPHQEGVAFAFGAANFAGFARRLRDLSYEVYVY